MNLIGPESKVAMFRKRVRPDVAGSGSDSRFLLRVLLCFGIQMVGTSPTSRLGRALVLLPLVLVHLLYLDYLLMIALHLQALRDDAKILLGYAVSNTTALVLWHALRRRRCALRHLLQEPALSCGRGFEVAAAAVCALPLGYSLLSAHLMVAQGDDFYAAFYKYGRGHATFAYLVAKCAASYLLTPTFPCLVAVLYCGVCRGAARTLAASRTQLETHGPEERSLREYAATLGVLERARDGLSAVSLLLVLCFAAPSFILIATVVQYRERALHGAQLLELIACFSTATLAWAVVMLFAAQVAVEARGVGRALRRLCHAAPSLPELALRLRDEPPLVFSGGEMVQFERSLVLSALGNLFTYTLLIMQLQ